MTDAEKLQLEEAWGEEHDKVAVRKKVMEIYEAATGKKREQATASLKSACRKILTKVVGTENAAELDELKAEGVSKEDIIAKVEEMLGEVTDPKMQELVEEYGTTCRKIYASASRKRRHDGDHKHEHNLEHYIEHHLNWISEEQKAELRSMRSVGASRKELQYKVLEFYEQAEGKNKEEGTKQLQHGCREILSSVIGPEKAAELRVLKESGATHAELDEQISKWLEGVDEEKKNRALDFKESCKIVFGMAKRKRRHEPVAHEHAHTLEHYLKHHLKWLTLDQKDEIRLMKVNGNSRVEIQAEILKYYEEAEGETKKQATEQLQGGCRELLVEVVGEDQAGKLKKMKESGASLEEIQNKVNELVSGITDEHKIAIFEEFGPTCKKLMGAARKRRHGNHGDEHHDHHEHGHTLENYLNSHLKWLATEQKDELRDMKKSGIPRAAIQEKVIEFFEATEGEKKEEAINQLQGGCRELLNEVVGKDEAIKLKELKETGASAAELLEKVESLLDSVTDAHKMQIAKEYGPSCKRVFGVSASRKRRHEHNDHHDHHNHDHSLENYLLTHLKWLSSEQKDELRGMKANGDSRKAIQEKVFEFFDLATGETKELAVNQLQGGCRELLQEVVGEDEARKLKELKETGASFAEIETKLDSLLADVIDEHKVKIAKEYGPGCKRVFGVASRSRRHGDHGDEHHDHHEHGHTLENYLNSHLKWLTTEQKDELRDMKKNGMPRGAIQDKVFEFFNAAEGKKKEEAINQLQGGCRELLHEVVGKDEAMKLKELKETGASAAELAEKVGALLEAVTDNHKKQLAKEYGPSCRKVFGVAASRKRRAHSLEEYFKTHLSWLDDQQKETLRLMKVDGESRKAIEQKIFEFYNQAEGETKEQATTQLKDGCRKVFNSIVGPEKAAELKALKERGATLSEIEEEVSAALATIGDEGKKRMASEYGPACKKLFKEESRRRRDHHHGDHTLEDYFKSHLKWLDADQKDELRALKADGKSRKDIQAKIMEFYKASTGEIKDKATEQLKGGCRELLHQILGETKTDEVKKMRESGASFEEVQTKVEELIAAIDDDHKKKIAIEYGPACKQVFAVSRRRRDHAHLQGHHKLEDYFKSHLKWLDDEEREELTKMKADGKSRSDIQAKVFEFYNAAEGEKKKQATEQMKGGCRQLLVAVVGAEKAEELKVLKETGASFAELSGKVDELLGGVEDEHKKKIALEYGTACRKVFAVAASRNRRGHHEHKHHHGHHSLEDYFKSHLKWLSEEQKDELRALKTEGKTRTDIQAKVFEFFDAATGETKELAKEQLKGGCRELLFHVVGRENADGLKNMRDSGASHADIQQKIEELLEDIDDDHKKQIARDYGPACKKVFDFTHSRKRREHSAERASKLEKIISVNSEWMKQEQIDELKKMKEEQAVPVEFREKIMQFYEATEAEDRRKANLRLQATCKVLLEDAVGSDKVEELEELRRAQVPREEIIEKVDELFDEIENEKIRKEMDVMRPACERVMEFTEGLRQRRKVTTNDENLELFRPYLEDWLSEEQLHELEAAYYSNAPEKTLKTMVVQYYLELSEPRRQALEVKWKGQCLGWLVEVTTEEERDNLQLLMRTKQIDVLREQILVFMNKLDDVRRRKVALTREVCENLFGLHM
ncbi:hypothetical protein L596_012161 [Steinernema carpocapsae]|uniref:Polyprotein allergen nematode domain-containing protein n=2 Tax=Steinernema carpocapsae TaxID=34508 RepID=A0A4U5NX32_STECR|nr:hypothetical protein L596_012161 [Steinernema carpocapsae]